MINQDERLKEIFIHHKLKDKKALAIKAEIHQSTLTAILQGGGRIDSKNKLQKYIYPFSLNWIVEGKGTKFIKENHGSPIRSLTKRDIKEAVSEALSESGVFICPLANQESKRGR